MTAIAYRDGVLAADSLTLGGDTVRGYSRKIVRSEKGTLGAAAGLAGTAQMFRRWIENGRIDEWIEAGFPEALPVNAERNEFGAIIVTAQARVICVDWQGKSVEIDAPFHAEGGAENFLIGAMAAGASAEEAVRLAIEYDVGCGGEVQVEPLGAQPLAWDWEIEPHVTGDLGVERNGRKWLLWHGGRLLPVNTVNHNAKRI